MQCTREGDRRAARVKTVTVRDAVRVGDSDTIGHGGTKWHNATMIHGATIWPRGDDWSLKARRTLRQRGERGGEVVLGPLFRGEAQHAQAVQLDKRAERPLRRGGRARERGAEGEVSGGMARVEA
eukprot:6996989-Prymnesium_polylepis.1